MMCNNPRLDLVNINVYTKFGKILKILRNKIMTDGMTGITDGCSYSWILVGYLQKFRKFKVPSKGPFMSTDRQMEYNGQPKSNIAPTFSKRGNKKQLTVEGRIKLKHLNLCIRQNIIQLRMKWTIDIVTKYHSKLFIIWMWSCL